MWQRHSLLGFSALGIAATVIASAQPPQKAAAQGRIADNIQPVELEPGAYYQGPVLRTSAPTRLPPETVNTRKSCYARVPGRTETLPVFNFLATGEDDIRFYDRNMNPVDGRDFEGHDLTQMPVNNASVSKLGLYYALLVAQTDPALAEKFDFNQPVMDKYMLPYKNGKAYETVRFKTYDSAADVYVDKSVNEAGRQLAIRLGYLVMKSPGALPERPVPATADSDPLYYPYLLFKDARERLAQLGPDADPNEIMIRKASLFVAAGVYYANIKLQEAGADFHLVNHSGAPPYEVAMKVGYVGTSAGPIKRDIPLSEARPSRYASVNPALARWYEWRLPTTDMLIKEIGDDTLKENYATVPGMVRVMKLVAQLDTANRLHKFKAAANGVVLKGKTGTFCSGRLAIATDGFWVMGVVADYDRSDKNYLRDAKLQKIAYESVRAERPYKVHLASRDMTPTSGR